MKSLFYLSAILFTTFSTVSADRRVNSTMTFLGVEYEYEFVRNLKTTTNLRIKGGEVFWSREWDERESGMDQFGPSKLVAIRKEGNVIVSLISFNVSVMRSTV